MLACAAKLEILDKVDNSQSMEGTDGNQCMLTCPCYRQGLPFLAKGLHLLAEGLKLWLRVCYLWLRVCHLWLTS